MTSVHGEAALMMSLSKRFTGSKSSVIVKNIGNRETISRLCVVIYDYCGYYRSK